MKRYLLGWLFCFLFLFAGQSAIAVGFATDGSWSGAEKPYVMFAMLALLVAVLLGLVKWFGVRGTARTVMRSLIAAALSVAVLSVLALSADASRALMYLTSGLGTEGTAVVQWALVAFVLTAMTWSVSNERRSGLSGEQTEEQ